MTLQELQEKVANDNFTVDDFKNYYEKLSKDFSDFKLVLENACDIKKDDKELLRLLLTVSGRNVSKLMDNLKSLGYKYRVSGDQSIKNSISSMGYKILEQTRAGKRDDVYYSILRIFVAANEKFPLDLVEAFKPHYSDEIFKVLIFTFISGVIGEEK
ncbi:MAG: hypothetical protein N2043_12535 [Ignavibacterium sp.]|nr:hypothetical protein [Ignavibacterium sp.]